jgi:hypothetical protein
MAERLDATFFAFRKREGGGVLLGSSIAFFVAMLVLFIAFGAAVFFLLGGSEFFGWYSGVMEAATRGETTTTMPPGGMSAILLILPLEFVFLFVLFILIAAYEAACVRWMVRGERSGALNLDFGHDMWRVYGTYWAWVLYVVLGWIGFFALTLALTLLTANVGAMGGLIAFVGALAYLIFWFYATVRLSPAAATSIGIGQFAPLKAWSVTRDRFWALFGAYFLLFILYIIVFMVAGSVFFGAYYAQILSGIDMSTAQTDPEAFFRSYEQAAMAATQSMFSSPAMIALYIGGQVVLYAIGLVFYVLWFGVESRAVQAALEEGKITREPAAA